MHQATMQTNRTVLPGMCTGTIHLLSVERKGVYSISDDIAAILYFVASKTTKHVRRYEFHLMRPQVSSFSHCILTNGVLL